MIHIVSSFETRELYLGVWHREEPGSDSDDREQKLITLTVRKMEKLQSDLNLPCKEHEVSE